MNLKFYLMLTVAMAVCLSADSFGQHYPPNPSTGYTPYHSGYRHTYQYRQPVRSHHSREVYVPGLPNYPFHMWGQRYIEYYHHYHNVPKGGYTPYGSKPKFFRQLTPSD